MFDCGEGVLFFEGFILFSINRGDVLFQKALIWSHLSTGHSPRRILASSNVFWQTPVGFSYVSQQWGPSGSPSREPPFIELVTDGAS